MARCRRCVRVVALSARWASRPDGFHEGRLPERLHDDTVLLGLDAQRRDLVGGRLRRLDSEAQVQVLEADRHIAGNPTGAATIEVAFDLDSERSLVS